MRFIHNSPRAQIDVVSERMLKAQVIYDHAFANYLKRYYVIDDFKFDKSFDWVISFYSIDSDAKAPLFFLDKRKLGYLDSKRECDSIFSWVTDLIQLICIHSFGGMFQAHNRTCSRAFFFIFNVVIGWMKISAFSVSCMDRT